MPMELPPLLHVDERLIVANKPSGMLSVPGRGADKQDCLIHRVQQRYADALIVHRLDMATSGLLLLARGAAMQRQLSLAFAARAVGKRYIAVVAGHPGPPGAAGEIALPLLADWPNRPRQKVDLLQGKPSLTRYRVLSHEGSNSRVELEPVTGRSHQLRVHLQQLGHPILGDALYASAAQCAAAPRLLLHASHLYLDLGPQGTALRIDCPPDF
jgi:tRNA pseudouridine32 synthase/23S rRNA pseudouridine746 synthase